ncbi:hypothetical protein SAMD00019534_124750, partial [Acytostelium subglobosum LB1]|uniref:hypothetical protein n=1 Tax=Acytostelium subglobosum LB1 TaxID=1410327 RepID=UPI0006450618
MDEITRLYQIKRTLLQMLADRGYMITSSELEEGKDEFKRGFDGREKLDSVFNKKEDAMDKIFIFFPKDPKVGLGPIKEYVKKMKDLSVSRAIIVVQQAMTPFAKQALAEVSQNRDEESKKMILEHFNEAELLVNITHHQLVPKHILLTKEEKHELLTRYKMKETQLPRIQINDPVSRYFGLQRGNVVKIVRPSETAGRYITYRLVV